MQTKLESEKIVKLFILDQNMYALIQLLIKLQKIKLHIKKYRTYIIGKSSP